MIEAALAAVMGFALGAAWCSSLRMNTDLYLSDGTLWRPVGILVLRLGAVGIAFALVAHEGALPLLAALAGFLAARTLAVRRARAG
jgi:F1F0 ATPase subunit 2